MATVFHWLRRDERGIVAIEFALLTPVLIMLVVGLIDMGRVLHRQMTLDRAVRSAADYAVAIDATANLLDSVVAAVLRVAPPDDGGDREVEASITCLCGDATADCNQFCGDGAVPVAYINIGLSETVDPLIPYPLVGQSIRVTSSATVRVN
jgi:Flp pilus assembly pilin Flp